MSSMTIGDLVKEAFRECGFAAYDYDIDPEEDQTALNRLRGMWGTWEARGIRCGFNFSGKMADDSGLPESALETTYLNLARRIAPGFGKTLSAETIANARLGYDALLFAAARPQTMQQPPTLPRGAGTKSWRTSRPFNLIPCEDPLQVTPGDDLDIL